jgi:hypothetical protein
MTTALDSSVILDVLTGDARFGESSERLIRKASQEGRLVIGECVAAEILPAFRRRGNFEEFLRDWEIDFLPSSLESSIRAGTHFAKYVQRGGKANRVLPDFLIGAHAAAFADRLAARDRGYYRDYFSELKLISPE